jgi:4-alpha-glucanotransferase
VFGDLQIGFSGRDVWYARPFLLAGYVLGAPPSRTNPQGQPWNYPVLDPRCYFLPDMDGGRRPGPALLFVRERMAKLCGEYDGLRIDHPHGLVCPWVYRAGADDPIAAVQQGARLFAAPDLVDHPELAEFAIARPDQLDRSKARYDDNWIVSLEPAQVHRYATLFAEILRCSTEHGQGVQEIASEILSTQPYPIKRVLELYGLGRFRITQKADLDNPADVYRGENAAPADWIMLGNHDTPSIWQVTQSLCAAGRSEQQAVYLADRLNIPEPEREQWIRRVAEDPGELAQAKCADLFVGPAGNVMIFFTDLLGIPRQYNQPGIVSAENWSLRIAPGYRQGYRALVARKRALNLPAALAAALRARGSGFIAEHGALLADLESAVKHVTTS